jgi:hypothetical protein
LTIAYNVEAAPVFEYRFPASWDGAAPIVTDLSGAGNHAVPTGAPVLSNNVPPNAPQGSQSANTLGGGFRTQNSLLLSNAAIAAAGGFRYDATFFWDGTRGSSPVQKIIDYAGTEFLQLQILPRGDGILRFGFNDDANVGLNLITPINAGQWYNVSGIFDTQGNSVAPDGSLSGQATLIVNGQVFAEPVTKTNFGDSLNRRIGIGNFSNSPNQSLEFHGDIFSAAVNLGPIPEPSTAMLAGAAAIPAVLLRRRSQLCTCNRRSR